MKKVLLIIGILAVGTLIGVYIYGGKGNSDSNSSSTGSSFKNFLPFGNGKTTDSNNTQNSDTNTESTSTVGESQTENTDSGTPSKQRVKQISDFGVSGFALLNDTRLKKDPATGQDTSEVVPAIRYVERSNGHIHEMYMDTEAKGKVSNSTIPSIYEAFFGNNGNTVVLRYLSSDTKTIQTYVGTLSSKSANFLGEGVRDFSMASDGSAYFYLSPLGGDVAGTIVSFLDNKKVQLFTSTFTEWTSDFGANNGLIFLTTKPSVSVDGALYATSMKIGGLSKIISGIKGLTTKVNHAGNKVLLSRTNQYGIETAIYNIANRDFTSFPVNTFPEKCVWSKDDTYIYCAVPNSITDSEQPDSWYKGVSSFNDTIYKINLSSSSAEEIYNTENDAPLDVVGIQLSEDTNKLFFINKKDSTLWSLDLN